MYMFGLSIQFQQHSLMQTLDCLKFHLGVLICCVGCCFGNFKTPGIFLAMVGTFAVNKTFSNAVYPRLMHKC